MPTSLIRESDVDVLIIGAGPAGLMACNALARAGVKVKIIDRRSSKVAAGQADGIQPRTIEVLQSYGLADRLLKEANQMHMVAFYNPSPGGGIELTDRVPDVTVPTARYPFEATLHQGAIESIFRDSMRALGVQVQQSVMPISMQLSEDPEELQDPNAHVARVVLKNLEPLDGQVDTEIVHAKFVLGTDGAHSWVRKTLGIAMEGEQTDYVWGVVDMIPETDFPDIRNRCAIHSNNGSCMIIPREEEKVRLYIQLGGADAVDAKSGRVDKSKIGPHQLLEVARKSLHPYVFNTPKEFDWWTIYIIGQRVAAEFSRHNRVFIAGDACHTHSPKAGQGMNASMNDSHNLAWKITHVLRGWADLSLLHTYEQERRKYAQELISFDRKFAKLFSGKPRSELYQDGVSHEDFLQAFRTFGGFTSGIGIHYAESVIVNTKYQAHAKNLAIGQRMPPQVLIRAADGRPFELQDMLPADGRFKILLFAGNTSHLAQQLKIQHLAEELAGGRGVLHRFCEFAGVGGDPQSPFDLLAISSASKVDVRYNDLPPLLKLHWSKIFIDDRDIKGVAGGDAYANFGIDRTMGAVVIVRPDGYVGMVAPFDRVRDLNSYFGSFMRPLSPIG